MRHSQLFETSKRRTGRETDMPNAATSRNAARKKSKGNPIQVPSNNADNSNAYKSNLLNKHKKPSIIARMNTKQESTHKERAQPSTPTPTRAITRLAQSKKRIQDEVIEIESDGEGAVVEELKEEEEKVKPKRRRLIQNYSKDDSDDDTYSEEHMNVEPYTPPDRPLRRKTARTPLPASSLQTLHQQTKSPKRASHTPPSGKVSLRAVTLDKERIAREKIKSILGFEVPDGLNFLKEYISRDQPKSGTASPTAKTTLRRMSEEEKAECEPYMLKSRTSKASEQKTKPATSYSETFIIGDQKINIAVDEKEEQQEEESMAQMSREVEEILASNNQFAAKSPESALKHNEIKEPVKESKEAQRISVPTRDPPSTTKEPEEADKESVETPMEPAKKAKPLPFDEIDNYEIQPVGSDEHFLTYPFSKKKSITVYERDYQRLDDETYLNDTIIDVFPKIWADEYPNASIYTFSSFFFTKLAGTYGTIHYDTVQRWTSSIDIFEKKFIIIPVAQNNHWFILLVTNPGYCIGGEKGKRYHQNDEMEVPESEQEEQTPKRSTRRRMILPGTNLDPSKPYIMALDPLGLNKQSTAKCISQYLKQEAITKLNIDESDFIVPEIVMTPCPGQDNFTDCGVFCLHYMKSLYQYPDDMMDILYKNTKDDEAWDIDDTLPNFRAYLKRILKKQMKSYREYLISQLDAEN